MFPRPFEDAKMSESYFLAQQRLLLFDYDGTLTPIVENPAAAILSQDALSSIKQLATDPRNEVWIISGRSSTFLEQIFDSLSHIGLVAEHGSFLRMPGSADWDDLTATVDMNWQEEVFRVFQRYTNTTPRSSIEKKRAGIVWHFHRANQEYAISQAAECKKELQSKFGKLLPPLEFVDGKCILEARLKSSNKGQMADRIVESICEVSGKPPDFVLCFGDDITDEDMFYVLRVFGFPPNTVYCVFVGERQTATYADWILSHPTEVIGTIMTLNEIDRVNKQEDIGQGGKEKEN